MTPILAPSDDATVRFDDDGFEWGLELIQVPDVGSSVRRSGADASWERPWAEFARRGSRELRPRRRLRREFRVAACVCLAFAPILTAAGAWTLAPTRGAFAAGVYESPEVSAETESGQAIRLSIKPVETELEAPVVIPGYLLDVERREEVSHEGS